MAGLKETIIFDNPISYWTFDFDRQDSSEEIIDEIDNTNPLLIHGENYFLEQPSLNTIETSDGYSIDIAKNGQLGGVFANTFLEAQHTISYNFDKEFTIEFIYYKQDSAQFLSAAGISSTSTCTRPLILKQDLFSVYTNWSIYGSNINFKVLTDATQTISASTFYKLINKTNHVVCSYKIEEVDIGEYRSHQKLYLNGKLVVYTTKDYVNSYPNLTQATSILMGGNSGNNWLTDFQTESLKLDYVAIYDYALEPFQIATHYRKTKQYVDLIKEDSPTIYCRLNEPELESDFNIYPEIGSSISGEYHGNVLRNQNGPTNAYGTYSVFFYPGSSAYIYNPSNSTKTVNINQSYTLEFWFNSVQAERGILIEATQDSPNYSGITLQLNYHNNQNVIGGIQFNESLDDYISYYSIDNKLNDGKWHHVVVMRESGFIKLYVDNELVNSKLCTQKNNGLFSRLHIMDSSPGRIGVSGYLSEVVFYAFALQEMQITNRYNFTNRYKLYGQTLLQGNPVSAKLTILDDTTNEKLLDAYSTSEGEFNIYMPNDKRVVIITKIPGSNTTGYLIDGPVKPAQIYDNHLSVN